MYAGISQKTDNGDKSVNASAHLAHSTLTDSKTTGQRTNTTNYWPKIQLAHFLTNKT